MISKNDYPIEIKRKKTIIYKNEYEIILSNDFLHPVKYI